MSDNFTDDDVIQYAIDNDYLIIKILYQRRLK